MVFGAVEGVSQAEGSFLVDEGEVRRDVAQACQIVADGFFAPADDNVYLVDTRVDCLLDGVVDHGNACNGEEFLRG